MLNVDLEDGHLQPRPKQSLHSGSPSLRHLHHQPAPSSLQYHRQNDLTSSDKLINWAREAIPHQKCSFLILFKHTSFRTNSQIMDTVLCRSVTKNLTAYRFNSAGWGLDDMKAEIHSFPTMYIIGGGKWGRNGSKLRFSEKKWSKNSFFVLHKFGSTDFEGVSDPYFWRYR